MAICFTCGNVCFPVTLCKHPTPPSSSNSMSLSLFSMSLHCSPADNFISAIFLDCVSMAQPPPLGNRYFRMCSLLSHIRLFSTPWMLACQAALLKGFPEPVSLVSPALAGEFLTVAPPGRPLLMAGKLQHLRKAQLLQIQLGVFEFLEYSSNFI